MLNNWLRLKIQSEKMDNFIEMYILMIMKLQLTFHLLIGIIKMENLQEILKEFWIYNQFNGSIGQIPHLNKETSTLLFMHKLGEMINQKEQIKEKIN